MLFGLNIDDEKNDLLKVVLKGPMLEEFLQYAPECVGVKPNITSGSKERISFNDTRAQKALDIYGEEQQTCKSVLEKIIGYPSQDGGMDIDDLAFAIKEVTGHHPRDDKGKLILPLHEEDLDICHASVAQRLLRAFLICAAVQEGKEQELKNMFITEAQKDTYKIGEVDQEAYSPPDIDLTKPYVTRFTGDEHNVCALTKAFIKELVIAKESLKSTSKRKSPIADFLQQVIHGDRDRIGYYTMLNSILKSASIFNKGHAEGWSVSILRRGLLDNAYTDLQINPRSPN